MSLQHICNRCWSFICLWIEVCTLHFHAWNGNIDPPVVRQKWDDKTNCMGSQQRCETAFSCLWHVWSKVSTGLFTRRGAKKCVEKVLVKNMLQAKFNSRQGFVSDINLMRRLKAEARAYLSVVSFIFKWHSCSLTLLKVAPTDITSLKYRKRNTFHTSVI